MHTRPTRLATMGVGLVLVLSACAGTSAAPAWTYPPAPSGQAAANPGHGGASPAPAEEATSGEIVIEAFDMGFTPAAIEVPKPGTYKVEATNAGSVFHDVTFADGTMIDLEAAASADGTVTIPAEGLTFICSVPGHEQAGMTGAVTVAGQTEVGEGGDPGGPGPGVDIQPDPDAPDPVRRDPVAPKVATGAVQNIEFVMTEREMTVAPGFVQKVWTFEDTVPGPVLRVKLGDTVRLTLKNAAENLLPHSIDFHSSYEAWNDEMRSIAPGEELVYEFTADKAGVYMYHCGTEPALHHIANGMFGMMIVEPEGGLGPVDYEFALVQSEWYLGQQGKEADLTKAMAAAPAPDFVVLNGVANQYKDGPIEVETGKRIRIFVLDAGPSVDSSFHVVGTIFDRVIKEGMELDRDNPGGWGSQSVDLSPSQGAIVELEFKEDGLYPIVTHAFNFVGRGALGLVKAGDGDPLD